MRVTRGGLAGTWLLLAGGVAVAAQVSVDVSRLTTRRPVILEPAAPSGRMAIEEDSLLAAGATPDFADVRLMDANGQAMALDEWAPTRTTWREILFREIDPIWVEGDKGQPEIRVDLGEDIPSPLTVEFSGPSANGALGIYGSHDGAEWIFLPRDRDDGPGSLEAPPRAVGAEYRFRLTDVRRYLRFVQDTGFPAPSSRDRIRLLVRNEIPTPRQAVAFRVTEAGFRSGLNNLWRAVVEIDGPPRALTRIDFEPLRHLGGNLSPGVEFRLPDGGWRRANVDDRIGSSGAVIDSVTFEPVRTKALRITVGNADAPNPPLSVRGAWATPQIWTFTADRQPCWLGYGDRFAVRAPGRQPVYGSTPPDAPRVSLGPPERNPFHREPGFGIEWLRRRPGVLTLAMVGVLAVVAWLTLAGRRGKTQG